MKYVPVEERFWTKVDKTTTCWNWTASRCEKGYGQIRISGRTRAAHRVAYELTIGPIAEGALIDHVCRNRSCVNPDHLRTATNKQNLENQSNTERKNKSGIRGVYWHAKSKKWRALVGHNGRLVSVGLHATTAEAEAAVIAKRLELFTHNELDRVA